MGISLYYDTQSPLTSEEQRAVRAAAELEHQGDQTWWCESFMLRCWSHVHPCMSFAQRDTSSEQTCKPLVQAYMRLVRPDMSSARGVAAGDAWCDRPRVRALRSCAT